MSLTIANTPQVSCLTCNSKVEISSTKNIYKTTFTQTGESLASFVSSTLSLAAEHFRSSYLCLQCLNLFGKLEEASRKVQNIKCEIHKVFKNSYNGEITIAIQNPATDTSIKSNSTQVSSSTKPKVIITQYIQRKSSNTLVQKKTITNNFGLPVDLEKKNTNIMQLKNNHPDATRINLKTYQQCLKNANSDAEKIANAIASNNALSSKISRDNDDVDLAPSLKDHQYSQLPVTVNKVVIREIRQPASNAKVLSAVQQKVSPRKEKKVVEPKKLELPNPESYTCSNCGIKKDTMKDLKQHYKTHAELYPYMCEKCGKVYKKNKSLKIHINTHDRVSLYTCTTCNKCFTLKGALKKHLLIHRGENPYECQICVKKFVRHSSYKMHMLMHTQEKKHKCDLCPYAFMSLSHLKRHMRTHTTHRGEKRHSCEICGKRFHEQVNVVAHMKIHDPRLERIKDATMKQKRPIQRRCERCKINFASAGEYNVHIRKHTPENMPSKENEYVNGIQLFETQN